MADPTKLQLPLRPSRRSRPRRRCLYLPRPAWDRTTGGTCTRPRTRAARAGFIDYAFGHLNNAAYLTHAELARWQMLAYAGLFPHMTRTSTHLVVAGTTVRYRREIKPFRCTFRIESYFGRIENQRLWTVHDFFVPDSASSHDLASAKSRAQMVVPCVWVRKGKVVDPQSYLQEAGVDEATIQSLCGDPSDTNDDGTSTNSILKDVTSQYAALEESMRRMDSLRDK
jgi:acyl-CoA thioesterase FadM